jgi:RHS repeat-associated protein
MNTIVRKATLLVMLLAVAATVPPLIAADAAPSSRYIVVLKSGTSGAAGVTDAQVTTLGGRIEMRLPTRLEVTLSERSADVLRNYPAVKYLQRVSTDGRSPEEVSAGQSTILRLHPQTMVVDPPSWTSGTFQYDGSGNIYTIGVSGESGVTPHTYTYDELSRLKQATNVATQTEKFSFDAYGNMTRHDVGSASTLIALDPANNNRLQSASGVSYDAVGNLASDATATYTYDPFSQLREKDFSVPAGTTDNEVYLYTAGDERIGVKQNDTWTWSIRDFGGKVLRQYQSSATQPSASWLWMEDYVYRDGLLLGADRPPEEGGRRYMHLDHLGTPRLVTGANGVKVAEHELAPFGIEPIPLWEDTTHGFDREDPMRFTGHERDFAQLSRMVTTPYLDYMHARFYNPAVGRFLSIDLHPANPRKPTSWNRYTYSSNNPIVRIDPDGLRDIYVAIWNARLLSGSVGHVGAFELNGKAILSQFPEPHAKHGKNTIQKDYGYTVKAEGRQPDLLYLVHVPNDAKFDAAAAAQRAPQTKSWDWWPDPTNSETNCVVATATALNAGGVPVPAVHDGLTPDEFGLQLGALFIENSYDKTNDWSVSPMESFNGENIRSPSKNIFLWLSGAYLFDNSFGTQIEVTRN